MPTSTKQPKLVMLFTIPGKICPILKSLMVLMLASKANTLAFSLWSRHGCATSVMIFVARFQTFFTPNGDGTFINDSVLNARYIPGNSDRNNGSVVLTLTGTSAAPCNSQDTSEITITIKPEATLELPSNLSFCPGEPVQLNAIGTFTSISWTHNGNGSLNSNTDSNPIYTLASDDTSETVVFTAIANLAGSSCAQAVKQVSVTINEAVSAEAGDPDVLCSADNSITLVNGANVNGTNTFTNATNFYNADLDVYNCLTGGVSGTDLLPDGDDPLAIFNISRTVNEESGLLYGFEFAGQHLFGDGYGVTANYTSVNGDLEADRDALNVQFALTGMNDSANLSGFYETDKYSVRLSWNWRDEFLGGFDQHSSPVFTEEYEQWDLNASYSLNDKVELFVQGLNLTEEVVRTYVRYPEQLLALGQYGTTWIIGGRYRF